jgi:Uma2 family endonuclease
VRYIGSLKLSMITVYLLVNDEYAGEMFRVGDRLISPQFPALNLMADQIFAAGK